MRYSKEELKLKFQIRHVFGCNILTKNKSAFQSDENELKITFKKIHHDISKLRGQFSQSIGGFTLVYNCVLVCLI